MENIEARHPTIEDFTNNRKFCIIHLTVKSSELSARVTSRNARITKERDGYRINPHGMLDWINLGEVELRGCGRHDFSGVIIDYIENESSALGTGRKFLEVKRAEYVAAMREEIASFEALEAEIVK